jgi:hypothetical protein
LTNALDLTACGAEGRQQLFEADWLLGIGLLQAPSQLLDPAL